MAKNKGGRPKLPKAERASEVIALRVTDAERKELEEAAKRSDKSLSDWARDALLAKSPLPPSVLVWNCPEGVIRIETPNPMPPALWRRLKQYVEEVLKPG